MMKTYNRVVFLDIDGVLQPAFRKGGNYHDEVIMELCRELEDRTGGCYPYSVWCPSNEIGQMDLAAVYYDWDRDAVERLRYALEVLDAGIVLSTNWREDRGRRGMAALLAVHGLDEFLCGYTETPELLRGTDGLQRQERMKDPEISLACEIADAGMRDVSKGLRAFYGEGGKDAPVPWRSVEIREYLDRHPEITSYVAIDDMDLTCGLDGHFVQTSNAMTAHNLVSVLDALSKEDGPYRLPSGCLTENVARMRHEAIPLEDKEWLDRVPIKFEWR